MKVPVSWLKEYVDVEDSVEGLAEKLTFSGIEVEGIDTVGGDYTGMVVGEVVRVDPHPNADRLTLCRVFDGQEEHPVVCGAPNARAGMKSAFAPVGSILADGTKLKKAKIRGEVSMGMLCAEDELGLSEDHTGILELDDALPAGTPLANVLGAPEVVLELEITPNRADCLCLIGIAREVAALYRTPLKSPEILLQESEKPVEQFTAVDIEDPEGCPRYTARILHHIRIGPSPTWMQQRLKLAGVRPINNVVDITNYVMLETGHPLHAFDHELLREGRIRVRRARAGERMVTLDDIERDLTEDTLLITDVDQPVAIAGVMGGGGSEIREKTQTVLLESACFKPQVIRKTSQRLALSTESSYRFERNVDIGGVEWASRRASALMAEYAGGVPAKGVIDEYPGSTPPREISCRWAKVRDLVGVEVTSDAIRSTFSLLGLEPVASDDRACTVRIPTFRPDLEREVDLVEEFARLHGLEKIPTPAPRARIVPGAEDRRTRAVSMLRQRLVALGLREIMNYSLVSEKLLDLFDPADQPRRTVLPYPISEDQSVLRTSLLPQMVENLGRNHARQIEEAAFFELGRVYLKQPDGSVREEERVALGLLGPVNRTALGKRTPLQREEVFLWMKGLLESLLTVQRIGNWRLVEAGCAFLEAGFSTKLEVEGEDAGILGLMGSTQRNEWRLNGPVPVAELSVDHLLNHAFDPVSFTPYAPFPPVVRDIAIILDKKARHEDVLRIIHRVAPKELEKVGLFDIFEGKGIEQGKKSLAYTLTYRSKERSLTDEEANDLHETIKKAIQENLGAEIRES